MGNCCSAPKNREQVAKKPSSADGVAKAEAKCKDKDEVIPWATAVKPDGSTAAGGGARRPKEEPCIVQDADEDYLEVVCVAGPKPTANAAADGRGKVAVRDVSHSVDSIGNSQEPPVEFGDVEEMELSQQSAVEKADKEKAAAAVALSKKQQEAAARLAEQRKHFDNEKFRGAAHVVAAVAGHTARCDQERGRPESLISLNVDGPSMTPAMSLPGGIDDEPTQEAAPKTRRTDSGRASFDADDECLMDEIVETLNDAP